MAATDEENPVAALVRKSMSESPQLTQATLAALRSTPIVEFVVAIQEPLTTTDDKTVSIGLYVLGMALQNRCPTQRLNKAAVVTLIQFLGRKCRRYATCDAAVEAVHRMFVGLKGVPETEALLDDDEVLVALLDEVLIHVHVQSMLVTIRQCVIETYYMVVMRTTSLERMGYVGSGKFLKAYMGSMEGERDPNLLLKVFQMHSQLLSVCCGNGGVLADAFSFVAEDFFESCASYFPVLFVPPPGCTVTREMLKSALNAVLQQPCFVEYNMGFLCHKLSSPSSSSKTDAMELLSIVFRAASCKNETIEGGDGLLSHLPEVLTTIRAEALKWNAVQDRNPEAFELLRLALSTLTEAARCARRLVGDEREGAQGMLMSLLEPIVGGALSTIENDTSAGRTYATLLHATARSAIGVAVAIAKYLLPLMEQLMFSPTSPHQRLRRLENTYSCLGGILSALEEHAHQKPKETATLLTTGFVMTDVLQSLWRGMLAAAQVENTEYILRVCAESLATWVSIATTCGDYWMSKEDATLLLLSLLQRCFASDVDDETAVAIATAIGNLARVQPEVVCRAFFAQRPSCMTAYVREKRFLDLVKAFGMTASNPLVSESLVTVLLNECVEPLIESADAMWGSRAQHTVDETFFTQIAQLMGHCSESVVKSKAVAWIHDTLKVESLSGFDFAVILFTGLADEEQQRLLLLPDSNSTTASSLTNVALCGATVATLQGTLVPTLDDGYAYMERLIARFSELLARAPTSASDESAVAPACKESCEVAITLRSIGALSNKMAWTAQWSKKLYELVNSVTTIPAVHLAELQGTVAKGLLARGAHDAAEVWLQALHEAMNNDKQEDLSVAAIAAYSGILKPPKPLVSVGLWEQRFFQRSLMLITDDASAPNLESDEVTKWLSRRLSTLAALVSVAKTRHVQAAEKTLLSFISRHTVIEDKPEYTVWGSVALLLSALYQASQQSEEEDTSSSLCPVLEFVLRYDAVLNGLLSLLESDQYSTMVVKRCVLRIIKAMGVELVHLRDLAKDETTEDPAPAAGLTRSDVDKMRVAPLPLDEVFGLARKHERRVAKATQAALSDAKRLIRKDAADCRHVWNRWSAK